MHTSPWQIQPGATIHALLRLRGGMPASAPRIKMPANNRMHSSAALRTTDMWSNVIGVCMFVWVGGWVGLFPKIKNIIFGLLTFVFFVFGIP